MARKCILTGEQVLYLDCQECDSKRECRDGHLTSERKGKQNIPPIGNTQKRRI